MAFEIHFLAATIVLNRAFRSGVNIKRKSYPSDVRDEEWAFCATYLTLMTKQALQRIYPLREIFNALRHLVKMGGVWHMMPHDLPPWHKLLQKRFHRRKSLMEMERAKGFESWGLFFISS